MIEDVKKCYTLFLDENRSSRILKEYQDEYMYSEVQPVVAKTETVASPMECGDN